MTEEKNSFEGAEQRHELWEKMGCQVARTGMSIREYKDTYGARHGFVNQMVFKQYVRMLRIIFCPACEETNKNTGYIHASAFVITVEDDVMTTWPAMGHFTCHHCGFEEWHPMKYDPRQIGTGQLGGAGGVGYGGAGGVGYGGQHRVGQAANLNANQLMQQYQNAIAQQAGLSQQALGNALPAQQSARMQQLQNAYSRAVQQRPPVDPFEKDLNSILGSWV